MMQTAIRDSLVGYLHPLFVAAYPTVPIVFDNGPFDWNNPPETFVEVEIEFHGGEQVNLAWSPVRRLSGYVYVCVHVRVGQGSRQASNLVDWFSEALKFATLGDALLQAPEPGGAETLRGWYLAHLKVPFLSRPG